MNVGVIGIGSWGRRVLGEYADLAKEHKIDGFGICDSNSDVLKKYKQEYEPDFISDDYSTFLTNQDVDAVHICLPNKFHYPVAKEALMNGKTEEFTNKSLMEAYFENDGLVITPLGPKEELKEINKIFRTCKPNNSSNHD